MKNWWSRERERKETMLLLYSFLHNQFRSFDKVRRHFQMQHDSLFTACPHLACIARRRRKSGLSFPLDIYLKRKQVTRPMRLIIVWREKSLRTSIRRWVDWRCRLARGVNDVHWILSLQFQESPAKVPIHAIILAAILFLVGSVMITLGALLLTGTIKTEVRSIRDAHADRSLRSPSIPIAHGHWS